MFFLFILVIPAFCYAQFKNAKDSLKAQNDTLELARLPLDSVGNITYLVIENMPNTSKDELYNRAKIWAALAFKSANNVIQLDDRAGGNLIIKALTSSYFTVKYLGTAAVTECFIHFSVHVTTKDNKYRLILSDFNIEMLPSQYGSGYTWRMEDHYNILKDWNTNVKTGNMKFNREHDELGGPNKVRPFFDMANKIDAFAQEMIKGFKSAMTQSAKADDF